METKGSLRTITMGIVAALTVIVLLSLLPGIASSITWVTTKTGATSTPPAWVPDPWESEEDKAWVVSRLQEYDVYLLGNGTLAGFIREAFERLGCEDKLVCLSLDEPGVYHGDNSILLVDGYWLARNLDKVDVGELVNTVRYIGIAYLYPERIGEA